jgi:hypothetical protein
MFQTRIVESPGTYPSSSTKKSSSISWNAKVSWKSGITRRAYPRLRTPSPEAVNLQLSLPVASDGAPLKHPARGNADRAALIGRLHQREDAAWLAELLIDLEEDEPARLRLVAALRLILR